MKTIKKDFVAEDTPSYCNNRPLSSGKAYYLEDSNGNIYYGGKTCAEKHTNTDLTQIPDLTKSLINNVAGHGGGGRGGIGSGTINHDKSLAITYLILREEKLLSYPFIQKFKFQKLTDLYNKYITNEDLAEQEVKNVLFYIDNSKGFNDKLSLKNLETCYAYDYIIERALTHVNNRAFIEGLLSDLQNKCTLTNAQINGLGRWLENLPQMEDCHLRNFD